MRTGQKREERRGEVRRMGCGGSGRQAPYVGSRNSEDQDPIVPPTLQVEVLRIERDSGARVEEAGTQGSCPLMESVLLEGDNDVPQVWS